ncbi:hypothetical protein QBC35DRAFT_479056, partial [Podospora australis]
RDSILDLTEMKWTNYYNAAAPPYDSPKVVRDWYANGDLATVEWSSPEVETLFSLQDPSRHLLKRSCAGRIGIVLALLVAYCLWRYTKRHEEQQREQTVSYELPTTPNVVERAMGEVPTRPPQELEQHYKRPLSRLCPYTSSSLHELQPQSTCAGSSQDSGKLPMEEINLAGLSSSLAWQLR